VKLWLSKNSEVSIHDQIVTQIVLAVTGGDLKTGDKLPSTRELARRYDVHPNTVAAAYRSLEEDGTLGFRHGSGYYVADGDNSSGQVSLENLVSNFFESAARVGFVENDIFEFLDARRKRTVANRILLVESDVGLRDILVYEIASTFDAKVEAISFEEFAEKPDTDGAVLTAMFDEKPKIDPLLQDGRQCIYLGGRSVSSAMANQTRPSADQSIAVVSGWEGFLTLARVMLLAAKIPPGNLITRSTGDDEWQASVAAASMIICDSLTSRSFPDEPKLKVFPLISDKSLDALRAALQTP
jgi:DNA-binding transcriptional regulator YhcF (GntR family)